MARDWDEEDDPRARAARSRKEKTDRGRYKVTEGAHTIRILDTPRDKKRHSPSQFMEYLNHMGVGPQNRTVRCGKDFRTGDGECWICDELIPKLQRKGKSQAAAKLSAKPTMAIQVAVPDKETGGWRGPLLLFASAGKTNRSLAFKLQGIIASTKRPYLDHKKGYNITFERQGTGMTDTNYSDPVADDDSSRVPKRITEMLKPFADVIPAYSRKRQKAAYFGEEDNESVKNNRDEEEEDDVAKKKHKKKYKDEDEDLEDEDEETEEDEDEEEDEEDEDEDEDEPKKKKKKKSKKSKKKSKDEDEDEEEDDEDEDSDEDEDEEEEDEDEEEEKPKRKKKKGKKSKDEDDEDEDDEDGDDESADDEDEDEEEESEDEDEDEDEDEEEEKPKRKKKKRRG